MDHGRGGAGAGRPGPPALMTTPEQPRYRPDLERLGRAVDTISRIRLTQLIEAELYRAYEKHGATLFLDALTAESNRADRAEAALRSLSVQPEVERLVEALENAVQDAHGYGLIRDHWRRNDSVLGVWQECPGDLCSEARRAIENARAILDAQRTKP